MSAPGATESAGAHLMQCMEVWGGNRAVDGGVVMAGLDAWVYNRPYHDEESGGDVYYVSSCASGRVTRLLVADVSGHGTAVAATGENLRMLMRRFVNHIDQKRFVVALNEQFTAFSSTGGFATALVGTFFAPTREFVLTSAGHPAPLLYRAAKRTWEFLTPVRSPERGLSDIPLGVDRVTTYGQTSVRMDVGDLLLCYTDSLIETRDASGNLLDSDGLHRLIESIDPVEPERLIRRILEEIEGLGGAGLSEDDLTMLLIRPNGLAPRMPLGERLRTPWRLLRGLLASLWPHGGPTPWPEWSLRNIGGAVIDALNRRG